MNIKQVCLIYMWEFIIMQAIRLQSHFDSLTIFPNPFLLYSPPILFLLPLYPHLLGHFSFMVFQYIVLFCFHIWKFLSILFYAVMYHCQVIVIVISVNFVYKLCYCPFGSQVSSGSIVSDYGLDDRAIGVRSPAGAKDFSLSSVSRPALGPSQPPVQWVLGVLSPLVKAWLGHDADHSPPSSAEVENE
jgi:hypothetical protein